MPMLKNYNAFAGRHWETGSLHNALAYQGAKAPHTGKPISEALLLGISGGITFGYFTFEYEGFLPHIALLTRNTFDPLDTIYDRLALPREVVQTPNAKKGEDNLLEALESGHPAIIRADIFSLPHYAYSEVRDMWAMMPMVVYGVEDGVAFLADRSGSPITVPMETLTHARSIIKKDKFRVMTLDAPDMSRLAPAVSKGIWQCISLFTEAPPKGAKNNFGLAALDHWAKMLTNTRNKQSWARYFEAGERLWMALAGDIVQPGAYTWLRHGQGNSAERGMYADFLDEAAQLLNKPDLTGVSALYRESETLWDALAEMLLPDYVPLLKETKNLLDRRARLYVENGSQSTDERLEINERLKAIQQTVTADFPMSETEVMTFRERLAEQVLRIHDKEREAVECLQSVMA